MAGERIYPISRVPVDSAGRLFPFTYSGATNARKEEMMGVEASVDTNASWHIVFPPLPASLPSGTAKFDFRARANATTGDAKFTPSWACYAVEENPDTVTLNSEGIQTISWGAGDADQEKALEVTADADTLVGGEKIMMTLQFNTTDWTLAAKSGWEVSLVWE